MKNQDDRNALCHVRQRISGGTPIARGSMLCLPDGTEVPGVRSIKCEASALGEPRLWITTVELLTVFGEPIGDEH